MKPTDLIKDSFNQSPWQRGFLQNASETKNFESEPKIVELTSFEETMLPHLDAAHNLARWLLRNEQDAQEYILYAIKKEPRSRSHYDFRRRDSRNRPGVGESGNDS